VPAILDVYEIPYTFSDPTVLAVCLDKALTKTVARAAGVPTPDWHVVTALGDIESCQLRFPVIAKPLAEGTGKGIDAASKISERRALRETCARLLERYDEPVLVERFLPGRELTVGILGTGAEAEVIGTLEIRLRPNAEQNVYSYVNKEQSEELCEIDLVSASADLDVAAAEQVALAVWRAVGCRDAGRVDLRCDENGSAQIMEINPLAGLHPTHSDLPMLWTALGRDYEDLIDRIVEEAKSRSLACRGEHGRLASIATWLREG
jgi:D-alanine-D-alanine ligase